MMSTTCRAGLVLLGLLSLGDLSAPLFTDGETPPMFIALIGAALGALSLALVAVAWRRRRIPALIGLVLLRLLSALTAVPAFLVDGVPAVPKTLAGIAIVGTVLGVTLVLAGSRRPVAVAS